MIDILSGINLPPWSTVLIGSASSIAAKGIQTYGEDIAVSMGTKISELLAPLVVGL
jgi:hypothetical protein